MKKNPFPVILIIMTLLNVSCSAFGIRTAKEPDYTVVTQDGEMEIREYAGYIIAKTHVEGDYDQTSNQSFRRLARYIFGENTSSEKMAMTAPVIQEKTGEKIEMTAPVIQEKSQQGWTMSFVMPAGYTMDNLPQPMSDQITLEAIPPKTVAVLTYSGTTSEQRMNKLAQKLIGWLGNKGYSQASAMRSTRYDPPWTLPFLRRNEIHIDVKK
jgi:DNA gyrase inhibitor GyrI